MPQPIVDRLYAEVQATLKLPEVIKKFDELDAQVSEMSPKQFATFWRAEITKYQKNINDSKITA